MHLQLRIHTLDRVADLSVGEQCVTLLTRALERHNAPTVAVVHRDTHLEIVELRPVAQGEVQLHNLLGGLTRSTLDGGRPAVAVGLMGRYTLHPGRPGQAPTKGVPAAQVFIEWSDCSWWQWRALLSAEGDLLEDTITTAAATQGDPLPAQLGRWWSWGRGLPQGMDLRRTEPALPAQVH